MDFPRIKKKLGECEHTAFFMDSTNVIYDGKTTSEEELKTDLKTLLDRPEDRIFLTLFASNVHRMNTIAKMAKDSGRKLVLMGRSVKTYMEAGFETGHTSISPDEFLDPSQMKNEKGRMLVFLSGCQGDYLSALRRFSFGEDSSFKPAPRDLVVFSSKVIPGNEKKIYRIYNKLTEFGAEVITASDHLIHASGHPGKEDLQLLLKEFTPDYYFPIHGESYMLKKHREFIDANYPEINTATFYNYQEIIFGEDSIKIQKHEHKDPRLIHGKHLEIEKTQISQRRKMATQGAVFISYHKTSGHLQVSNIGLPLIAEEWKENLIKKLLQQIRNDLATRDETYFKDQLKISTRQFYNNFLGYKPVTEVHLY
jgi:ribonuclease J